MPNEMRAVYRIVPPLTDERRLGYFNKFVKENYGDFTYIDKNSIEKERDSQWIIMGGVSRPYEIFDAGSEYPHVRYDVVPEAFSVELTVTEDDTHVQLRGVSRKELRSIVNKRIKSQTSRYEAIVLDKVKDKLAQIPQIQTSHTPIILIMQSLNEIFDRNIDLRKREYAKWNRYFPLLEDLEVVKSVGDAQFTMGEAYKQFEKLLSNNDGVLWRQELVEHLFGYVIQNGSQYLSQYLNLTATKPYIGLTSTFYRYATILGRNFKTTIGDLQGYYKEFYRRDLPFSRFRYWVSQLDKVDILKVDQKETINGNESILQGIIKALNKTGLSFSQY